MSLINTLTSAGKAIATWHRRHRAYAELMDLDDRTLADIGIRRSQIRGVVDANYSGPKTAAPQSRRQPARRPKAA